MKKLVIGAVLIAAGASIVLLLPEAAARLQGRSAGGLAINRPAPDFEMTDHRGKPWKRQELNGPFVVYFGYSYCKNVCQPALGRLHKLLLNPELGRLSVVFISLDPARDTPARLAAFAKPFGERFTALTSAEANLQRVARAFQIAYDSRCSGGECQIHHSDFAYLVDREGIIQFLYPGANETQIRNDFLALSAGNDP